MAAPAAPWRERAWRLLLVLALVAATASLLSPPTGQEPTFPLADKLGHLLLFAGLALLARRAYRAQPAWGIFAALVLYGAAIELAQARIPERSGDVLDLVVDALGAALVFLLPRR